MRSFAALLVLALACLLPAVAGAEIRRADERQAPTIQLFTMGQGDSLFERFGHAAVCVQAPDSRIRPQCYNYGTTDFTTPVPLTWGFLRGRADFWVSRASLADMLAVYEARDRTVWRQDLPLTREEALAVWDRLRDDTVPENRHFTYHHFHDNCTTRLRDIIDEATNGRLRAGSEVGNGRRFRRYVREGFADETMLLLLTDVILGRAVDQEITGWEALFLPDELRELVRARFEARPVLIRERQGAPFSSHPGFGGRWWIILLALILALPVAAARRTGKRQRLAAILPGTVLGLLGVLVWTLALFSVLPELRWNEALLVFLPCDLLLPILRGRRRVAYARLRVAMTVAASLLLVLGVLLQPLWLLIVLVVVPLSVVAIGEPVSEAAVQGPSDH